jgi:hypothetical protein
LGGSPVFGYRRRSPPQRTDNEQEDQNGQRYPGRFMDRKAEGTDAHGLSVAQIHERDLVEPQRSEDLGTKYGARR